MLPAYNMIKQREKEEEFDPVGFRKQNYSPVVLPDIFDKVDRDLHLFKGEPAPDRSMRKQS